MMTTRKKTLIFWIAFIALTAGIMWFQAIPEIQKGNLSLDQKDDGIAKVFSRVSIEKQAKRAVEAGKYEEALALYQKALNSSLINEDHQRATARGGTLDVLTFQKRYSEALDQLALNFEGREMGTAAKLIQKELKALNHFKATNDPDNVIKHIEKIKNDYAEYLPPRKNLAGYTSGHISNILQLYDAIEDYDGGIAYIDMCLNYFKSAVEARGEEFVLGGFHNEFLAVRKAFEESKAGMPKICGDGGKTCIGRATHAIIQSDYFPW